MSEPPVGNPATSDADAMPLVSILLVTWNRRDELRKSIQSALDQTYDNIEIVVFDNASTDGTAEMVRSEFPSARLIEHHENLGCPSGRNAGFRHCRGDFIYLLDDDGWLDEKAIEIAVAKMQSQSDLGVVMSCIHEVKDGDEVGTIPADPKPGYRHDFIGCCSLLRTAMLDEVGYFPDDFFRQAEESDLALRMLDAGWSCWVEPASFMYHAPSPKNRDTALFSYYQLRNTTKTGLRHWPFPYNVGRVLINVKYAIGYALFRGQWAVPLKLAADFLGDLQGMHKLRAPVKLATMRRWFELQRQNRLKERYDKYSSEH